MAVLPAEQRAGAPGRRTRGMEGVSRLATACMAALAAAMAAGTLAVLWLVLWLLTVSLAGFLLGPGSQIGLERLPEPYLLLPAFGGAAGTALVMWWLAATGRLKWRSASSPGPDQFAERPSSDRRRALASAATLALLAAGCVGYLAFARLVFVYHHIQGGNDEGTYLYAARLVMDGRIPFRDFYFNQGPLFPYVIGLTLAPFRFDESATRLVVIACTLATLLVTYLAAQRLDGRVAGLVAFGLLASNLDFTVHMSAGLSANGAFTALAVALSALALSHSRPGAALVLAAVATGVRHLLAPLPVVVALYLAFGRRRPVAALLGGLVLAGLIFGTFLLLGGERAVFGYLVNAHRTELLAPQAALPDGLRPHLTAMRNGAIAYLEQYIVFFLGAIPAAYLVWTRRHPRWDVLAVLAVGNLVLLAINLVPYPVYARYPVTQLPLLAVLDAVALVAVGRRLVQGADSRAALAGLLVGLGVLLVLNTRLVYRGLPFVEDYRHRPPVEMLYQVSDFVRSVAVPDTRVLTFDTQVATQAGLQLLPGLEGGTWGIVVGMDEPRARAMGVVTFDMILDMVEQGVADIIVESDQYGVLHDKHYYSPRELERIDSALERHYTLARTFERVSDWGNVRVYVRRAG